MEAFNKEGEILNSARLLFSSKGFRDTSVQDIAKSCKVSKATIYKLFQSKEEILIKIITDINKQIFAEIDSIKCEEQEDKVLKLKKKFAIFLKSWHMKREFISVIYENQSLMKDEKVKELILKNRMFVLKWYRRILLETYGESIEERLSDVIIILNGIMKELKNFNGVYVNQNVFTPDFYKISSFIIDTISTIVKNLDKIEPFLEIELLEKIYKDEKVSREEFLKEVKLRHEKISRNIEHIKNKKDKKCILESFEALEEELEKENAKEFLVESQIVYLSKFNVIKKEILYLEKLYIKSNIFE